MKRHPPRALLSALTIVVSGALFMVIVVAFQVAWMLADSNRTPAWFEVYWSWGAGVVGTVTGAVLLCRLRGTPRTSTTLHGAAAVGVQTAAPAAVVVALPWYLEIGSAVHSGGLRVSEAPTLAIALLAPPLISLPFGAALGAGVVWLQARVAPERGRA